MEWETAMGQDGRMPLSTMQVAMLPTHDPLVGRIVGSVLYSQELLEKPQVAVLEGTLNRDHPIKITYQRDQDGAVLADGFVGSVEIHQKFVPQPLTGTNGSRTFGVAGSEDVVTPASVHGTVGGEVEKISIFTGRSTEDVKLTDELRHQARDAGGWTQKQSMEPTLGGQQVDVNVVPARYPTETEPIKTREEINEYGQTGGVKWSREFNWNMTTWNVAYSNRQTWQINQLYMVEEGSEKQTFSGGDETTSASGTSFAVSEGKVEAKTQLVTISKSREGGAVTCDVVRRYEVVPDKPGVVKVSQQFGDTPLEFVIYPQK